MTDGFVFVEQTLNQTTFLENSDKYYYYTTMYVIHKLTRLHKRESGIHTWITDRYATHSSVLCRIL